MGTTDHCDVGYNASQEHATIAASVGHKVSECRKQDAEAAEKGAKEKVTHTLRGITVATVILGTPHGKVASRFDSRWSNGWDWNGDVASTVLTHFEEVSLKPEILRSDAEEQT